MSLQELAFDIYSLNLIRGFHSAEGDPIHEHATHMALVVSEFGECINGWRTDEMDTHLPGELNWHVELADICIRLLSLNVAYAMRIPDYEELLSIGKKSLDGIMPELTLPELLYYALAKCLPMRFAEREVASLLVYLVRVADYYHVELLELIQRKFAFNKRRADHSKEERSKPGGKKI